MSIIIIIIISLFVLIHSKKNIHILLIEKMAAVES